MCLTTVQAWLRWHSLLCCRPNCLCHEDLPRLLRWSCPSQHTCPSCFAGPSSPPCCLPTWSTFTSCSSRRGLFCVGASRNVASDTMKVHTWHGGRGRGWRHQAKKEGPRALGTAPGGLPIGEGRARACNMIVTYDTRSSFADQLSCSLTNAARQPGLPGWVGSVAVAGAGTSRRRQPASRCRSSGRCPGAPSACPWLSPCSPAHPEPPGHTAAPGERGTARAAVSGGGGGEQPL